MRVKNFRICRHGQSFANVGHFSSGRTSSLTGRGKRQAGELGIRLLDSFRCDDIVTSSYVRAMETASIVAEKLGMGIGVISDLLGERRLPSSITFESHRSHAYQEVTRLIRENFHNPEYRYSDEENFTLLRERAMKALTFLTNLPAENIVVVTHGIFMRMMYGCMLHGENLSSRIYSDLFRMTCDNGGIVSCTYNDDPSHKKFGWIIESWNDTAHLSDDGSF